MTDDDSLRRAYRDAMPDPASRDACPDPEALDRLARRDAPTAELARGIDHVMSCPRCLPEFELLRSVWAAERSESPAARRVPRAVWLVAALVVLAAGVVTVLPRLGLGPTPDPIVRGGDVRVQLVSPAIDAAVGSSVELTWRAVADVDRYDVEVLDAADAIVAMTATVDTTWIVDRDLTAGPAYRWRVTAVSLSGGQIASPIQSFTVRTP